MWYGVCVYVWEGGVHTNPACHFRRLELPQWDRQGGVVNFLCVRAKLIDL